MRVLISGLGYALASLALGAHVDQARLAADYVAAGMGIPVGRFRARRLNSARAIQTAGTIFELGRCPVDRAAGARIHQAAAAKRARKNARRLELAA